MMHSTLLQITRKDNLNPPLSNAQDDQCEDVEMVPEIPMEYPYHPIPSPMCKMYVILAGVFFSLLCMRIIIVFCPVRATRLDHTVITCLKTKLKQGFCLLELYLCIYSCVLKLVTIYQIFFFLHVTYYRKQRDKG